MLDPGETNNVWRNQPEIVDTLMAEMSLIAQSGRSTSGAPQLNNVERPNQQVIGDVIFPQVHADKCAALALPQK